MYYCKWRTRNCQWSNVSLTGDSPFKLFDSAASRWVAQLREYLAPAPAANLRTELRLITVTQLPHTPATSQQTPVSANCKYPNLLNCMQTVNSDSEALSSMVRFCFVISTPQNVCFHHHIHHHHTTAVLIRDCTTAHDFFKYFLSTIESVYIG